jgi:hypothetical protein
MLVEAVVGVCFNSNTRLVVPAPSVHVRRAVAWQNRAPIRKGVRCMLVEAVHASGGGVC